MRFAVEDIDLEGVRIRKGDAILVNFAAGGLDPRRYGEDAARFDVLRTDRDTLGFGHGVHRCMGVPLAQVETAEALSAFFGRFPHARLACRPDELQPMPTFLMNGYRTVPVCSCTRPPPPEPPRKPTRIPRPRPRPRAGAGRAVLRAPRATTARGARHPTPVWPGVLHPPEQPGPRLPARNGCPGERSGALHPGTGPGVLDPGIRPGVPHPGVARRLPPRNRAQALFTPEPGPGVLHPGTGPGAPGNSPARGRRSLNGPGCGGGSSDPVVTL